MTAMQQGYTAPYANLIFKSGSLFMWSQISVLYKKKVYSIEKLDCTDFFLLNNGFL